MAAFLPILRSPAKVIAFQSANLPPIRLLQALNDWAGVPDVFWSHRQEQAVLLREYRQWAKNIIVWLEMHGWDDAAARIDEALIDVREQWLAFEDQWELSMPNVPEDPRVRQALESLIEAIRGLRDALEDIADEVPESVWQGFGDV